MKKRLFLTALSVVMSLAAASAQIKVQVPSAVALDEQFNIVFVIEGDKPSDFGWECPPDFRLVWGPQKGTSSTVNIINGKRTSSSTTSYTYILMPTAEGTFTLPAASATVKGKTVSSGTTTVKVVKSGAASASSMPSRSNSYSISGDDLFMRLELSSRNVVVGESISAAIKLYRRVDIAGFEDVRFPSFDGFWNQVEESPSNITFHRETLGEEIYEVATLRSYTLIPQQSGDMVIDPAEIVCLVRVRNPNASTGSIFDSFFQDEYSNVRKRISTRSVTVHVSPLPQPQPADFCGGVGRFTMSAMLSRDSLSTHDAASLVVTVSGKGNLALVQAPKVDFPPDFEVYDVKTTDKDGKKIFEYPFIPRHHGNFEIPGVRMSFYDIASSGYTSLSTEPMRLKVSRSQDDENVQPALSQSSQVSSKGKNVRDIGSDIRYVHTGNPALRPAGRFFVSSPLFIVLCCALVLAAAAVWAVYRRRASRKADVKGERRRGASKMARKRLSKAGEYLEKNLYGAFYEELHKALTGFVADKFSLDLSQSDKETIRMRLVSAGADGTLIDEFLTLLEACEYARYSPASTYDSMNEHYQKALEVISSIDSSLKPQRKAGAGVVALFLLLSGLGSYSAGAAAPCDSLWRDGVEKYAASDWQGARDSWLGIVSLGEESAQLYTNIGSACFKEGNLAHAILYYERALALDPSYADARYNLEFAGTFLQDRIEGVPEFFAVTWLKALRSAVGSDAWAGIFLVMLALCLAGALMFLLGSGSRVRKAGFIAGVAAAVLAAGALGFSLSARSAYQSRDYAIVTAPVSISRSAPDKDSGTDLFVLHEGTKVMIVDTVGDWENIELADGRRGWILSREIEII